MEMVKKSFLYDMKAGTLKFLVNSVIDTLPTAANLVRWSKSNSDKCKLCRGRLTTDHCEHLQSGIGHWQMDLEA